MNNLSVNIETVINTLNTFKFLEFDDDNLKGENGVEVSYQVKLANTLMDMDTLPLQIVIYVRINGKHAYTWGCVSNEENGKFVKWFAQTKAKVINEECEWEDKQSKEARKLFNKRLVKQFELEKVK